MKTSINTSNSTNQKTTWFTFGVAILLIILFVYTGINKLLEMKKFIFQMRLVPFELISKYSSLIAWFVPVTELIIVVMLVVENLRIYGLYASLLMMLMFEVYIGWMKLSNIDLPCTCGGIISQMSWTTHFIFNAVIITLIFFALHFHFRLISNQNKLLTI